MKDPIAWTFDDIEPIVEACQYYKLIKVEGEEDAGWTAEEVMDEYGLNEEDSCGFLVYAYPTQDWQYIEFILETYATGLEQRGNVINSLNERMLQRQAIMKDGYDETMKDLKELGTIPAAGKWWQFWK